MNFLEIINKCLIELNYREVDSWNALTLNDHKRLKEVIKRVNSQICTAEDWPFLEREANLRLIKGQEKFYNPVTGKISLFFIDKNEYKYSPNYRAFLLGNPVAGCFSTYAEHVYIPPQNSSVNCKIFYNSDYSAMDKDNNEKKFLEVETDISLIPEAFCESVLVYGACLRLKGNPEHAKFKYWYSMFNDALAQMRSRCFISKAQYAKINIYRD